MSTEISVLAAELVPYMSAATSAYGGAVLARLQDDAADATVSLGRQLLQRIFGTRAPGEKLPEPVADIVSNPSDEDAVAALRLAVRKALQTNPTLQGELKAMLPHGGTQFTASGERAVSGDTISGTVITGDPGFVITGGNAYITPTSNSGSSRRVGPPIGDEPDRVVQISSLLPPSAGVVIRQRTFENTTLVGPAIVTPMTRSVLENCTFAIERSVDEFLYEVEPDAFVVGVIGLEDCTFRQCKFVGIGFMGPKSILDILREDLVRRRA